MPAEVVQRFTFYLAEYGCQRLPLRRKGGGWKKLFNMGRRPPYTVIWFMMIPCGLPAPGCCPLKLATNSPDQYTCRLSTNLTGPEHLSSGISGSGIALSTPRTVVTTECLHCPVWYVIFDQ